MSSKIKILLSFILIGFMTVANADEFVTNFDSLPLIKGFNVNLEEGFVFDKPEGRVASAYAYGNLSPEDVMKYYISVLPEFGWQHVKPYLFYREGEYLMIETSREDDFTVIVFFNFPKIN